MHPELEPLLRTVRQFHPKSDVKILEAAYERAAYLHRDQVRRSGDPYITHPLAVATILAELGMTAPTLAAALLHDTVEDTEYSLDALREDFGDEVAALVDGVTKLDKVKYGQATAAETVRKMVVAMARDIRVLVIKLADRLHNMRTLRWMPPEKQEQKARETLEIYAPLAHRLGMNTMKWELEDLSFATLYPKMYDEIVRLVGQRAPERDHYLTEVRDIVEADLREAKIKATVTGRPKHYYSVYQKMIVRGRDFADIYDLVGIRILVESVRDCYGVLGVIHARWNPVPGRFKDFIAMPKFNMYQSLHTTVIGPTGKPVELQIRTMDMHRAAEYGVAAHWRYKQGNVGAASPARTTWAGCASCSSGSARPTTRTTSSTRCATTSARPRCSSSRPRATSSRCPAVPRRSTSPTRSTPRSGHRTVGARVNGKLVPLESSLTSGDVVEIFTSKAETAGPNRDWLTFVRSPRARSKIKAWFSKERREEAVESGKESLTRAMRKAGLPLHRLLAGGALQGLLADLHYPDVTSLYVAVGEGRVSAASVVQRIMQAHGGADGATEDLAEVINPTKVSAGKARPQGDPGIVVDGDDDVWVKLARCCTPVPGDKVLGFVTRGHGVSVHRLDCVNVASLRQEPDRIVPVTWAPKATSVFLVNIQVEALDRSRLLSDVTRALSDQHVNILSASVSTTRDRIAISRFTFEMADATHLGSVLKSVRGVEGVYDVYRI